MGLSYTIDTPLRVAHFGIDSVVSIVDDELMEKMREYYCEKFGLVYKPIPAKSEDSRARRITAYLDLLFDKVRKNHADYIDLLCANRKELGSFVEMLPKDSTIRKELLCYFLGACRIDLRTFLEEHLTPGAIDVNIMTKVDKVNFKNKVALPYQFNDAHAALRGYAESKLNSSLILSAGLNPSLYTYISSFDDFFPSEDGAIRKKVVLKVSDFRSALVQGSFLAKKGIWVSEYRIESGLNCGGHAFATDGLLLGPILQEFYVRRKELTETTNQHLRASLEQSGRTIPAQTFPVRITVQGGVGTAEEHQFLLDHFQVDTVGWGTPFLLVPEATAVDEETRSLLQSATEIDLYRSAISPLGVPFNTLRGTTNDEVRRARATKGKPGSSCPKKLLALHPDFGPEGVCTASRKYQEAKLAELEEQRSQMLPAKYDLAKEAIEAKSCLCVGLANAVYLEKNIPVKGERQGVVVCPGPNLAYFDKIVSLKQMLRHIYGYESILADRPRPHMFIRELELYFDYLIMEESNSDSVTKSQQKKLKVMRENLLEGVQFYQSLFTSLHIFEQDRAAILWTLDHFKSALEEHFAIADSIVGFGYAQPTGIW